MARILVVAAHETLAERSLATTLVRRARSDGHDAVLWQDAQEGPARAVREADALVALLDRLPAAGAAAVALADAADKPVLGLCSRPTEGLFTQICHVVEGQREEDWWAHLPAFYERVRPFAGRVVRDRIPDLVAEAGHDVRFRQLTADEKPRFLKQKVANEAKELLAAELSQEKEEVADVLEALEAFILARGFDRDDLRRIKDHKRKQRGGFDRCFVVEATATADGPEKDGAGDGPETAGAEGPEEGETPHHAPIPTGARLGGAAPAGTGPRSDPAPAVTRSDPAPVAPRGAPSTPGAPAGHQAAPEPSRIAVGAEVDYTFDEQPAEPLDDIAQGRDIKPRFFEI